MKMPVIIVGAGGHGAVVADALLAGGAVVLGLVDRDPALRGRTICGLPVLGDDTVLAGRPQDQVRLVNGIGGVGSPGDALRRTVQERLQAQGWRFLGARHPAAIVSPFASVADDAQVMAGGIVQAGARVGMGCIVNTASVVEHDAAVDAWTHLAPRSTLCGGVVVGPRSHIGAGAVVRQGAQLGADTVVGAGAVVVADFRGGGLLVGIPARLVELKS